MKRIAAILFLLAILAGCRSTRPKAIMPGPPPTEEQEYLEGFADGYRDVRPLEPHRRDRRISSATSSYSRGARDGYITGRKDEMQQK